MFISRCLAANGCHKHTIHVIPLHCPSHERPIPLLEWNGTAWHNVQAAVKERKASCTARYKIVPNGLQPTSDGLLPRHCFILFLSPNLPSHPLSSPHLRRLLCGLAIFSSWTCAVQARAKVVSQTKNLSQARLRNGTISV